MAQIKAVIFDMDGVLIDAKDWHYEALNRALELFGYTINRYDHLCLGSISFMQVSNYTYP